MRSRTLRWVILITIAAVSLLVAAQLFWLHKIYNYEQKEFSSSVIKSIQGVYEDFDLTESSSEQLQKRIEQYDPNTFIFTIDIIPIKDTLLEDILDNLEDFQVFADCKVSLYDKQAKRYLFHEYLPGAASMQKSNPDNALKVYNHLHNYVVLYFPNRSNYILTSMAWWIFSCIILLIVLIALGLSIFYLYKQKFLNEIQNDFIQNVTHEFQTPLTTLILGLDAIAKPGITNHQDKFETYLKLMRMQTDYLKHHIENLMKVLKAEASGLVMEKSEVVPNQLIKNAVEQLHNIIEEKKALIKFDLEESNTAIKADYSSLYMSMLNLISNALKYSLHPEINIRTRRNSNHYLIYVKDNGIGIDKRLNKNLFKKFYRVPSGDIHNVKGLGLGLYFVKKVVEGHHGKITISSKKNEGSEFIIELPIN